jgi:hypothetical protein
VVRKYVNNDTRGARVQNFVYDETSEGEGWTSAGGENRILCMKARAEIDVGTVWGFQGLGARMSFAPLNIPRHDA